MGKLEKAKKTTKSKKADKKADKKNFDLEQAVVNILKELQAISERLEQIESRLDEVDDNVIDVYNILYELDLSEEDIEDEDEDE